MNFKSQVFIFVSMWYVVGGMVIPLKSTIPTTAKTPVKPPLAYVPQTKVNHTKSPATDSPKPAPVTKPAIATEYSKFDQTKSPVSTDSSQKVIDTKSPNSRSAKSATATEYFKYDHTKSPVTTDSPQKVTYTKSPISGSAKSATANEYFVESQNVHYNVSSDSEIKSSTTAYSKTESNIPLAPPGTPSTQTKYPGYTYWRL